MDELRLLREVLPPPQGPAAETIATGRVMLARHYTTTNKSTRTSRWRIRRAALVATATATATAAVAAVGVGVAGLPGKAPTHPAQPGSRIHNAAYAIDKGPDGSVLVSIRQLKDPERLQADLKRAGITALVQYVPAGMSCRGGVITGQQPRSALRLMDQVVSPIHRVNQEWQFRVFTRVLKPDLTLVLRGFGVAGAPAGEPSETMILTVVARGKVTPCVLHKEAHPPIYYESPEPVPPTPTPPR